MESMRALSITVDMCHEVQNCSETTPMKAIPAVTAFPLCPHRCATFFARVMYQSAQLT